MKGKTQNQPKLRTATVGFIALVLLVVLAGCGTGQSSARLTAATSAKAVSTSTQVGSGPSHRREQPTARKPLSTDLCKLLTPTDAARLMAVSVSSLKGPRAVGRGACLAYSADLGSSAELVVFKASPSQGELRARAARGLHGIRFPHIEMVPNLGDVAYAGSGSPPPHPGEAALGPSVRVLVLIGRSLYLLFASNTTATSAQAIEIMRGMFGGS